MKVSEMREKTIEELREHLVSLKEEQFNLKIQKSLGQLENTLRVRVVRRDIARVKTLITEKKGME